MSPVLVNPSRFGPPPTPGAAAYWAAVLADSPWGAWKQLETSGTTLADASGNTRNLTITGTGTATLAQTGPDGVTADAISWPASTLYAVGVNPSSFGPIAFTQTCLVYVPPGGIGAITPLMAVTNGSNSTNVVMFFDAAGKINARVFSSTSELLTSASALSTGWHHVVQSAGASGHKLRVDKVTLATGSKTSADFASSQAFRVHGHGTYANANGDGAVKIARPAFWTSQLTDTQTDAHYDVI